MSDTQDSAESTSARTYTTKQMASHFSVTLPTIRQWVVNGCPADSFGRGKSLKFNLDEVKMWRKGATGKDTELDPQREKALLDRERRLKVTAERLVLEGKLIPTAAVEEHWGQLVAAARAKFLSLPHKLAPAVVSCETLIEVENEARRLVNEALEELAVSGVPDMEATTEPDGQSMGGQIPETEPGGQLGAGGVEDVEGGISEGDTGLTQ